MTNLDSIIKILKDTGKIHISCINGLAATIEELDNLGYSVSLSADNTQLELK